MGVSPVRVNLFDPTAVRKAVTGQHVVINLATHIPPSSMRMSAERFTASGRTGIVLRFAAFYRPDSIHVPDMIKFIRKGWAPLPGSPRAFLSSISHDDAATAVVAALSIPAGIYNVTDDEPVRRREFVDSLAASLGVSAPKFPPAWLGRLGGALAEMLARSLRISNRKLRTASNWAPKYASVREGWPAIVGALPRLRVMTGGAIAVSELDAGC